MPQNWHQQNLRQRILEATATVMLKDELRVHVCQAIDIAHIVTHIKSNNYTVM
jgi:hypothetical protein